MGQRFIVCDREQSFLMPPDVREWLPERHLAWFVIDAVSEIDLEPFMPRTGSMGAAGRLMTRR